MKGVTVPFVLLYPQHLEQCLTRSRSVNTCWVYRWINKWMNESRLQPLVEKSRVQRRQILAIGKEAKRTCLVASSLSHRGRNDHLLSPGASWPVMQGIQGADHCTDLCFLQSSLGCASHSLKRSISFHTMVCQRHETWVGILPGPTVFKPRSMQGKIGNNGFRCPNPFFSKGWLLSCSDSSSG